MNIIFKKGKLLNEKADLLVFGAFSGTQTYAGNAKLADKALDGLLTAVTVEEEFGGKVGDILIAHTHGKIAANRVLVVGLGEKKSFNAEVARRAAAVVMRQADKTGATQIVCELMGGGVPPARLAQAMTEGALLADYVYLAYKPAEARRLLKRGVVTFAIVEEDAATLKAIGRGVALGEVMSRATVYSRDLVNEPAGNMTPRHLREHAEAIVKNNKNIKLKVLDAAACAKLGMNAYLAVAKGSDEPPCFLHLTYAPTIDGTNATPRKKICLIGKGVTFDSGGLSLKPSEGMETMKCDMAGAATVLGIFSVIADLEPNAEVHGVIAACENMPSGKAMRPGDIVTAMNGKSVEILNTDAEGRLALADSLVYAEKKIKPDAIVDLATLTGACMIGLGPDIAGLMSNDEKMANRLEVAAQESGELIWRLPLLSDYNPFMAGDHSDFRNISRIRYGGAITAGLFLKNFVEETPWVHLDIAGPAFAERDINGYARKGATGFGVRTILNWLMGF
jgi:leucyl aminopeptidase